MKGCRKDPLRGGEDNSAKKKQPDRVASFLFSHIKTLTAMEVCDKIRVVKSRTGIEKRTDASVERIGEI